MSMTNITHGGFLINNKTLSIRYQISINFLSLPCSACPCRLLVFWEKAFQDIYLWLEENSWKYGFIFRYPAYKTDLTGVAGEVWHYRYVGKEAAQEIYEQGVCLEEYLENLPEDGVSWAETD